MVVIGLTGGIGTGKSTVSQMLASLGATIIDADKLGHEALQPFSAVWCGLVDSFGNGILNSDQQINRGRLGEIVFNDLKALKRINEIMHPHLYKIVENMVREYRQLGKRVVVIEAAAFIEANWMPLADEIWVVAVSEAAVINRLKQRSSLNEKQTLARIHSQISLAERLKYAHVIINTECTMEEVRTRVEAQWRRMDANMVESGKKEAEASRQKSEVNGE